MVKKIFFSLIVFIILIVSIFLSLAKTVKCSKLENPLKTKIENKLHTGMDRDEVEDILKKMKIEYDIDKSGEMDIFNIDKDKHKYLIINFNKKYKYTGICLTSY